MTKICIVGLGYVGLPLAVEFGKKFKTVGFDINKTRVRELNQGIDNTDETTTEALKAATLLRFTTSIQDITDATIYIVTVPTPIDAKNKPDLTPIISASETVSSVLKKNDLIIYESTVYPGVTEEICVPILEKSGLTFNTDFYCGYSPERINPGDKTRPLTSILKITSGSTPEIAKKVDELYKSIITAGTHLAPSIKVAEAAKVIENTQRDVNIALINELALIFNNLNIDSKAVFEAAATKWNFINLRPGLVGGHCIGVDPYYLTHKAEEVGYHPDLILHARQINNGMAKFITDKTIQLMIKKDLKIKGSNILIFGLTFKENCPDVRNSKVFDLIRLFNDFDCHVHVLDPWISEDYIANGFTLYRDINEITFKNDALIGAVAHQEFLNLTNKELQKVSNQDSIKVDIKRIFETSDWVL
jgi:UDP-N-acetyl-D-galactosamine dehydrogenase